MRGRVCPDQRGVALVITLLVVTLLITLILEFGNTMRIEARAAANFRDDLKAYYLARAGVTFARSVLEEDAKDSTRQYDALTETWAERLPPVPLGDGVASVEITDEKSKLNVNKLATEDYQNVFRFFLRQSEVDEGLTGAIVDWTDPNDEESVSGGAESRSYEGLDDPYPAKNGVFDTLEELRLIQGMEDDIFNRLKPFLTVYGDDGKININTARSEVLMAFSEQLTESVVGDILNDRAEAPFEDRQELKIKYGEEIYNRIAPFVEVKSNVFSITSRGAVNGVQKTIQAVVKRTSEGSTQILYWRVE